VAFNNSGNIDVPNASDQLAFVQGTINMNAGSTVTGAGYSLISGGDSTWNIVADVDVQNLWLIGGNNGSNNIIGSGVLNITHSLIWQSGLMRGTGVTNVRPGATVSSFATGGPIYLDARTLNNQGTINGSNGYSLEIMNGGTLNNTGVISATTGSISFINDSTPATINNSGTFYINDGTDNFLEHNIAFNNSGLLDIRSGNFWLRNTATTFNQSAGTTRMIGSGYISAISPLNFQGGQLVAEGGINAPVNNSGATLIVGNPYGSSTGSLTISNNYTQGAGGSLNIDLGGHTAGTEYDQLHVTGVATLAGTLNTTDVNGFVQAVGDQFQVLTYASPAGAFGVINGGDYSATYNTTDLTLAVLSVDSCTTFADVEPGSTFYPFVTCLVNHGVISGYADCTFRPGNNVTRGQLAKIVALAAGYNDPPGAQIFEDVVPDSTFYNYVQNLGSRSIIGGYACGSPNEPCGPASLPYFRPGSDVTRGQVSKITAIAAGLPAPPQEQWTFTDVPVGSTFWTWVESLASMGSIGGYPCGGPGEPCDAQLRPYFRPGNSVTRGQSSKIVANTFFPNCVTRK
jgi:hypothetical protein